MKPHIPLRLPIEKLDWKPFIKFIGPANAALARYDGMLQAVINPRVLLSPLTTQEAVLSSKIEGTQATLEEVLAFDGASQTPPEESRQNDITEILNYRQAMDYAVDELQTRPMNLNLINKVHYILLDSVRGKDKARGEFRKIQNWIGLYGSTIENATYVPPEPMKVLNYMSNLEKYIHYSEDDFLVQLAIVHAQFEIIHPYLDGNGRVGRILIPLFLYEKKMLSSPMFYLSAYLEAHRDEYCSRLNAISKNDDWLNWISFFLKAVLEQAKANSTKTKSILDLYEVKKEKVSSITRSRYTIRAVDAIFRTPIFTTTRFIAESKIPKDSAIRIIDQLYRHKVLTILRKSSGRTPAIYHFSKLVDIVKT
jgi:Fic family protein